MPRGAAKMKLQRRGGLPPWRQRVQLAGTSTSRHTESASGDVSAEARGLRPVDPGIPQKDQLDDVRPTKMRPWRAASLQRSAYCA